MLFAIFYGELAETTDSVEICDCEYKSLLELFRFIYSDEANLTTDNVLHVIYLVTEKRKACCLLWLIKAPLICKRT